MAKLSAKEIRTWMKQNIKRFVIDGYQINTTLMVETIDIEMMDGKQTLDEFHPAWTIASELQEEWENGK